VSVNLSGRQLRERHLPSRVAQVLASSGLDPRRLTLEITETSVVDDLGAAGATLAALRELGCDHGQGYYFAKPLQQGSVQPFLAAHERVSAEQHTSLGDW